MKLLYAVYGGSKRAGIVVEDHAVLLPTAFGDIVNIISGGEEALDAIGSHIARADSERVALNSLSLLPPIFRFRRDILCAGWNYWSHFQEGVGLRGEHEKPRPTAPTFFAKGPGVVIGPNDPIAFDSTVSTKWDYEAESWSCWGEQAEVSLQRPPCNTFLDIASRTMYRNATYSSGMAANGSRERASTTPCRWARL
jgi:2,4-diketo-3-deoxy-L-fuconate hydrolase